MFIGSSSGAVASALRVGLLGDAQGLGSRV